MMFFLKASVLMVLFSGIGLATAEEKTAVQPAQETSLPVPAIQAVVQAVTLEEATKQAMQDPKNKVLAAKTEVVADKKVHVIKILTPAGHIQHIKIDAATGKTLDKEKK
jgi:uncharacterized membrane protein YkoI